MKTICQLFLCLAIILISNSCTKNPISNQSVTVTGPKGKDVIPVYAFNWETVDWMPTPSGQSQIPPPWIGQGSIASSYGADVVADHASKDGWQLMYSTFTPSAPGPLTNPYFILYNPYRGLMRVYLYTTTQFVYPSDYVTDGLTVVSSSPSPMLNFMGQDLVDVSQNLSSYTQIEPAPKDGSKPLAANKWYMLQYEFAFDPNMSTTEYSNIQLSWFTNFNNITQVSLGGAVTGTLNGTIGGASNPMNSALTSAGKTVATGALAVVGSNYINNNAVPPGLVGDPNNDLGLPDPIFTDIQTGLSSALKAASGNIPGAVAGILSAVIGGSTSAQTVSLNLNAKITLTGTQTTSGSFPSSPTSLWVPGTKDLNAANNSIQGYVPSYNWPLGVFNLSARPTVYVHSTPAQFSNVGSDRTYNGLKDVFTIEAGLLNKIVYNSAVTNIASVKVIKEDLLVWPTITSGTWSGALFGGSWEGQETIGNYTFIRNPGYVDQKVYTTAGWVGTTCVRLVLQVTPTNGAPASTIVKTFLANVVPN
ncbi:MAG: hypothetical protein JWR09_3448 [Mucilaginibacter sp.]|nr:hypothetical protein [Mucilaginibacter sp.]